MSDEEARRLAGVAPVRETNRIDDVKGILQLRVDGQKAITTGLQGKMDEAKKLKIALERTLGLELSRGEVTSLTKSRFDDENVESLPAMRYRKTNIAAIMEIGRRAREQSYLLSIHPLYPLSFQFRAHWLPGRKFRPSRIWSFMTPLNLWTNQAITM
jgi:hypothetical protein